MVTFVIPLLLFFFFCMGVGLLLTTMAVYFRDMFHLYGVLLNLLNYATPIFYPENIVPEEYKFLLQMNPLYYFFKAFRQALYEGNFPSGELLLTCFCIALITFIAGCLVFRKYQNRFILYI